MSNSEKGETKDNIQQNAPAEAKQAGETITNEHSTKSKKSDAEAEAESISTVYTFKITLRRTKPHVWRRVQVPKEFTFAQFHSAILQSMGWIGYHLHWFRFLPGVESEKCVIIRSLRESYAIDRMWLKYLKRDDDIELEEKHEKLSDYFPKLKEVEYLYDFGDRWTHKVVFEREEPVKPGKKYPRCINGMRACPPEDCGGVYGYEELIEIMNDPEHTEHNGWKSWLEDLMGIKEFNPEKFDPRDVTIR